MKERIIEFLKAENKSSAQFADEIGVQPSGISHILSGRNNPSLDFILKMLERYKYLSTDWLLFGKGSMYKDSSGMKSLFDQSFVEKPADINQSDEPKVVTVPQIHDALRSDQEPAIKRNRSDVEKIVWFYKDNSFEEFFPR
jgi:transcriptional regulator with XRE-family HTH domain